MRAASIRGLCPSMKNPPAKPGETILEWRDQRGKDFNLLGIGIGKVDITMQTFFHVVPVVKLGSRSQGMLSTSCGGKAERRETMAFSIFSALWSGGGNGNVKTCPLLYFPRVSLVPWLFPLCRRTLRSPFTRYLSSQLLPVNCYS